MSKTSKTTETCPIASVIRLFRFIFYGLIITVIIPLRAGAVGYLSFQSYDSLSADPVFSRLFIWEQNMPDPIIDSTDVGGYYFKELEPAASYQITVSNSPYYFTDSTTFEILDNETTYVQFGLEPKMEVNFVIYVANPQNAYYRNFYVNGTWDTGGRYNDIPDEQGYVFLNDIGNPPDPDPIDGYFSGVYYLGIDSVNSYSWSAHSERWLYNDSYLQDGISFQVLGDSRRIFPDTLYLNPSGGDPNWGFSAYSSGGGEIDLNRDGSTWRRWIPLEAGQNYPIIFRVMHSDFSTYGQYGVGDDTIQYFCPQSRSYLFEFRDNSDSYSISLNYQLPRLGHFPDSFQFVLDTDTVAVDTLRLYNFGQRSLTYSLETYVDSFAYDIRGPFSNPDGYGYIWTDSEKSPDLNYYWLDIEDEGILVEGLEDDNYAGPFYIGFPFRFYGEYYDSFYVSSNGYISLGIPSSEPENYFLPNPEAPPNIIAPYWDDYKMQLGGRVLYKSTSDSLIVSFIDLVRADGAYPYIFQLILTDEFEIVYQFDALIPPLARASTGMQNSDGSLGTNIGFRNGTVGNTMTFGTYPTWLGMDRLGGFISAGRFNYGKISIRNEFTPPGIYDARIRVVSNDPDTINGRVTIPVRMQTTLTGIDEERGERALPGKPYLAQNYPNPFNPATTINFFIPQSSAVTLEIYNLLGRKVAVLMDDDYIGQGSYSVQWNGKTDNGKLVSSGLYFYKLTAKETSLVRKMLLIK
ncbi:MAG: T9SS type A sorting domain-containing protein [candidate division Zixibacteria bacterium]|nr:T9SS type A sorting domain-containing protein [candidate division Zixibacteria bacterium]